MLYEVWFNRKEAFEVYVTCHDAVAEKHVMELSCEGGEEASQGQADATNTPSQPGGSPLAEPSEQRGQKHRGAE